MKLPIASILTNLTLTGHFTGKIVSCVKMGFCHSQKEPKMSEKFLWSVDRVFTIINAGFSHFFHVPLFFRLHLAYSLWYD